MIQRIQTIWLVLAAFTLTVLLFSPLAYKEFASIQFELFTTGLRETTLSKTGLLVTKHMNLPLLVSNIALILVCFLTIFKFKNRSFQKKFALLLIVFIAAFTVWCGVYVQSMPGGLAGSHFGFGAFLPIVAIIFVVLAIAGINKDEKLIRSADRLR
ncbi:DUF4293 domain-containing protein [Pedobacter sp. MW01-1-1]|uniref:DUF4293 domain-containing protein n=1 Tax=Pedobacter sp. MW01-1-1 TaxID=3383027 RepID=UPI003FEDAC91